jgi:hypothetical protein
MSGGTQAASLFTRRLSMLGAQTKAGQPKPPREYRTK